MMLKTTIFAAAALMAAGLAAPAFADRMPSTDASAIELAQGAAQTTSGRITGRGVRLRSEPSSSGRVIAKLSRGTRVTVLGRTGDYSQVRVGRRTGYVASQYVS